MDWALYYIMGWGIACAAAAVLAIAKRDAIRETLHGYSVFLRKPWKLGTFLMAVSTMIFMAPWTGDPTWDWFDAGFMGLFTFLSAPWSIAMIWQVPTKREPVWLLYVVACVWMFSASWSYDLYIYLKDDLSRIPWPSHS
jgi:hypothetical protein